FRSTTAASILTTGNPAAPVSTAGRVPDVGIATARKYCVANPAHALASNGASLVGASLTVFSTRLSPTRATALSAAVGLSARSGVTTSPRGDGAGAPDTVAASLKRWR